MVPNSDIGTFVGILTIYYKISMIILLYKNKVDYLPLYMKWFWIDTLLERALGILSGFFSSFFFLVIR